MSTVASVQGVPSWIVFCIALFYGCWGYKTYTPFYLRFLIIIILYFHSLKIQTYTHIFTHYIYIYILHYINFANLSLMVQLGCSIWGQLVEVCSNDVWINSDFKLIPIQFSIFVSFVLNLNLKQEKLRWIEFELNLAWVELNLNLSIVKTKWKQIEPWTVVLIMYSTWHKATDQSLNFLLWQRVLHFICGVRPNSTAIWFNLELSVGKLNWIVNWIVNWIETKKWRLNWIVNRV